MISSKDQIIHELENLVGSGTIYMDDIFLGFWYSSDLHNNNNTIYIYLFPNNICLKKPSLLTIIDLLNMSIPKISFYKLIDKSLDTDFRSIILNIIFYCNNKNNKDLYDYKNILPYCIENIILSTSLSLEDYLKLISSIYNPNINKDKDKNKELDIHETKKLVDDIFNLTSNRYDKKNNLDKEIENTKKIVDEVLNKIQNSTIQVSYNTQIIKDIEKKLFQHFGDITYKDNTLNLHKL